MKSLITIALALLALGIIYLIWLDAGCNTAGVMTWDGKVCFEDLTVTPNK